MKHKAKKKPAKKVPFGTKVPKQVPSPTGKPSEPRSTKPEGSYKPKKKKPAKRKPKSSMYRVDEELRKIGQ